MQAQALAAVAARLPPERAGEVLHEALEAAAWAIHDKRSRAEALAAVAARLPPERAGEVLHEALEAARAIRRKAARAEALAAVAAWLPPERAGEVLHEALASVTTRHERRCWWPSRRECRASLVKNANR